MGQVTLLLWQMPSCELKRRFLLQTGGKWKKRSSSKKVWDRAYGRLAYGSEEGAEGKEWLVNWGLLSLSPALNPRLSPEIYLKRPAHSNDWRLDIMLKKKAVRSVARLEGRLVGGGWLEGNLRFQGRERCPSWLNVWQTSPPLP